jgi:RNA polymerase sigma factor (sigma-70 family)
MPVTKVSVAALDFRALIQRAQRGDALARTALIERNLGLVVYVAKRFHRPGAFMEMEDLLQQGRLGLLKAIEKFDAHRRSRGKAICFSTYACYWIKHMICREIC